MRFFLLGITKDNHAVASILYEKNPLAEIGILVSEGEARVGTRIANLLIAGYIEALEATSVSRQLICAVPDPLRRMTIADKIPAGWSFATAIDRDAYIAPSATVGNGTIVHAKAMLASDARVGEHCIIGPGVVLDRGAVVESYCTIGPRVVVGQETVIKTGSKIGDGAVVAGGIEVGPWSEVGTGSVALSTVPPGTQAQGNPAKAKRHGAI
jgi:acetyltransferase EpsM